MDVFKATGHGGQKKNKTSNAIRLTLEHLSVTYTTSRSKAENISGAYKKLRMSMALDISAGRENCYSCQTYPVNLFQYFQKGSININAKNMVIGKLPQPSYSAFTYPVPVNIEILLKKTDLKLKFS